MVCSPVEQHGLRLAGAKPLNGVPGGPAAPISAAAWDIWGAQKAHFKVLQQPTDSAALDERQMNRCFGAAFSQPALECTQDQEQAAPDDGAATRPNRV